MKKKNITLKDIANETGLSVNTVSRILRGNNKSIPEKTCERVKNTANKLGYIPNYFAVGLRKGKTKSLAIINYNYTNPFYTVVTHHIAKECNRAGFNLQILIYDSQQALKDKLLPQVISLGLNGIFCFPKLNEDIIKALKDNNVSIVSIGSNQFEENNIDSVAFNDYKIGKIATEFLLNNAREALVFIGTKPTSTVTTNRLEGFRQCLQDRGLPCNDHSIYILNNYDNKIAHCIDDIFDKKSDLNGIFCYNDELANETMIELLKRGKSIPEEILIIGCDNIYQDLNFPSILPTVNLNKLMLAKESMARMVQLIELSDNKQMIESALIMLDVSVVSNYSKIVINNQSN